MDPVVIGNAATPTRAKSAGPSSPHRSPMEDTDSSGTRKRPRLDSGDRSYRSMSVDRPKATPSDRATDGTPEAMPHSSSSTEATNILPPMPFTPTKVTINVREPLGSDSSPLPSTETVEESALQARGGDGASAAAIGSPSVVSVHSSPLNSPEIEVAEIEDMNDEPAVTQWRPLRSSSYEAKQIQETILGGFPYFDTSRDLRKAMHMVATMLERHDLSSGDMLEALSNWIESYLDTTETLSGQWWDLFLEERDFWEELPLLVECITRRNHPRLGTYKVLQVNTDGVSEHLDPLQDFLCAWTTLVLRMVSIDRQTLREPIEDPTETPDLISEKYLHVFLSLISYKANFWGNLVNITSYDYNSTVLEMITRFALPQLDGVRCMIDISQEIMDRSQSSHALMPKLFTPIHIIVQVAQHYRLLEDSDPKKEQLSFLPSNQYEFFQGLDARLQTFISKQVPSLSIEHCQNLIAYLSELLSMTAHADGGMAQRLLREKGLPVHGLVPEDWPRLLFQAWRCDILKKCIIEGRMEIRVQGVESLQRDLLSVYYDFIKDRPPFPQYTIPQYLSDFLVKSKLVQYLMGVDSHLQLIQRCHNIIGFLVVTSRYSEADTDSIWTAIETSQDSRSTEAIMNMLLQFISLCSWPVLLYFVEKLNSLPIQAFDNNMIMFGKRLMEVLRGKWKEYHTNSRMDMPPYHLCIRLIRQCTPDGSNDPEQSRIVQDWAVRELRNLLPFGPSDADRRTIYQECLLDVSGLKEAATGSISAISALLNYNPEDETRCLAEDLNLTKLLVQDLAHKVEEDRCSSSASRREHERLQARLQLLHSLIFYAPGTMSPQIAKDLWDVTVGSRALDDQARESAWHVWINVLTITTTSNSFIDRCIEEFLPGLQSQYMVPGCLSFARNVSQYSLHTADSRLNGDQLQGPTANELLWHLSLSAPSDKGDLEHKAIGMLVALYLDSPDVQQRTRAATDAVHIQLVERCISQLTAAASKLKSFTDGTSSGEDEPMVIVASDDEVQVQKLSFTRSIMILKEFVRGVRARPMYSPPPQAQLKLPQDFHQIKGEPLKIRYQSFSGGSNTEIRTVEVGELETIEDLSRRLTSLTGYTTFTPIAGGRKLDFANLRNETLRDLNFHRKGLLLIKKAVGTDTVPDLASASDLRPMEVEILSHFKEMYSLLGMEDNLARQVFDFLIAFPPHSSITALVCSRDVALEESFPTIFPFKILYSVHALKLCLRHQLHSGTATPTFISHSVHILTTTLTDANINIGLHGAAVDLYVAAGLIDCLLGFLKESVTSEQPTSPISAPQAFIDRLRSLISDALAIDFSTEADFLACNSFSALLEASLHSEACWIALRDNGDLSSLLRKLLLEEPKEGIRHVVAKTIKGVCTVLPASSVTPPADFVPSFWNCVSDTLVNSIEYGNRAEQFFDVANVLLRSLDQSHRRNLDVPKCLHDWSGLLLKHDHTEFVGRDEIDYVVYGVSRLLLYCFTLAKSLGKPLQMPQNFMAELFRTHLFPEVATSTEGDIVTRIPNLHTSTREVLYQFILALSNDLGSYQNLLMLVRDLLPKDDVSQAWSWGIAQIADEYHFESNWNFERTKSIRSAPGYPGLRNLSNTCYMNSLFTQLFMNVDFRYFMLNTNVADGVSSQKLLHETQNLFGFMQNSMLKSIDSQGIADAIVTYENTPVDVSIQMDVDEFYNLLFDRWESQILTDADKKTFRQFYGGQIVQQIKSQECSHISERLEPFSAIQCDIVGKTTLAESLNAYVKGEFMKGDNKYSCTSCGSYVDAVKRACLKDTPDNLIFHLKRFDYDLMTGMRSKINDRFEFPGEIDMAPYNIDALGDSGAPSSPDIFELVGILVHSGTAESGHYYSYIRERPSNASGPSTWVEFNDTDVTPFDPNNIGDQCFGGWTRVDEYSTKFTKVWNAYMLFYERITPKGTEHSLQANAQLSIPTKCKMPVELENRIAAHNETFLRQYCLFDTAHAAFVRNLLEQLRSLNKATCSEDHNMEREALWLALEHLDHLLSRSKDFATFDKMLSALTRVIGTCSHCCKLALDWVITHDYPLRDLLFRCPHPKYRKDFSNMVLNALQYLRKNEPFWYGFDETDGNDSDSSEKEMRSFEATFHGIARRLQELWTSLPIYMRAWDDYFGLLAEMAAMGKPETHVLLSLGFLHYCLELLIIETSSLRTIRNRNPHYADYVRMVDKGRKFSFVKLTEFVANLLTRIDLGKESTSAPMEERPYDGGRVRLTTSEDELLHFRHDRSKSICVFLEKILNAGSNPQALRRIVQHLTLAEPTFRINSSIQRTIESGINVDPADLAAPFLRAALTYCECAHSTASIDYMIKFVASEVHSIGLSGGREHLEFFTAARRLRSRRPDRSPYLFHNAVLRSVPLWAPELLVYWDEAVRNGTLELLSVLLFINDIHTMDDEEKADEINSVGKALCLAATRRCELYVHLAKPVDGKSVEKIVLVIKTCLTKYFDQEADGHFMSQTEVLLGNLEALTVSDIDDAASDQWNNGSDDMPSDSDSEAFMAGSS